jgi:hypothetical protein
MIPYHELEKALARWKARSESSAASAVSDDPSVVVDHVNGEQRGSIPQFAAGDEGVGGLPPPPENTGEIDLNDALLESYEEDDN